MQQELPERPYVGVGVVVVKDGKILLGKDTHKGDVHGVPGGHWETGETLKEAAARETLEESGVVCANLQLISVFDFFREDLQRSYLSIGMKSEYVSGELTDQPEEGRSDWAWYTPDEALALTLFPPARVLIERYVSGVIFE